MESGFSFRYMNFEILFDINMDTSGRHVDIRD